jgi:hypothetical protein
MSKEALKFLHDNEASAIKFWSSVDHDNFASMMQSYADYYHNQKNQLANVILPNDDDAGIIAVNIASTVNPKLTANESAFFIAGFQECIKYLHGQLKQL